MRLKALLALLCMLFVAPLLAQTTTYKVQWEQSLVAGQVFADIATWQWAVRVDAGTPVVGTPTCVNGTPIRCTLPLPTMTPGAHTVTVTGTNAFGSGTGSLSGNPPSNPINITVIVNVVVP